VLSRRYALCLNPFFRVRAREKSPLNRFTNFVLVVSGCLVAALGGCVTQSFPAAQSQRLALAGGELEAHGVAFITPSTVTGQEEEKQAVALIVAQVMNAERTSIKVVTLPEALNAINRAGLSDDYKRMYDEYRDTGLFKRDMLGRIGALTGTRYIAQIKLQGFTQGAKERFGAFGLRIVETRYANVRLFMQIWDSYDGTIAWDGMQEMLYSRERLRLTEKPITLQVAVERAARGLVKTLPHYAIGGSR
jgi:hypothetical protein